MPESLNASDAALVRDLVYKKSAIVLDASKEYLLESRLEQAARESGAPSIAALVDRVRTGQPGAEKVIVEALTTHESSFFRDLYPFEAIKKTVLPELIEARKTTRVITIWSAACSSGQEPYSLAMMLIDAFPALASWPIKIVATDLSEPILARAREGRFRQIEVNRGLPAHMLVKYFEKEAGGTDWIIKPQVRQLVEFRQLNLLSPWNIYPRPDLVLMRNVLIYFDLPTKQQILKRLRGLVPADGALFLGSAETTIGVDDGWDRIGQGGTTYYRPKS